MEREPRQGRQRQRVEEKEAEERLTVNPSEDREGLAPEFEGVRTVEQEERCLRGGHIAQVPSGTAASVEGVNSKGFGIGQAICLAAGSSITNLKSAGTVLAWLFVQAVEKRREYESVQAATGRGGSPKAASFPMRRGETEKVFEGLKKVELSEASSTRFSEQWAEDAWLYLSLQATSSLAGSKIPLAAGEWTSVEQLLPKRL